MNSLQEPTLTLPVQKNGDVEMVIDLSVPAAVVEGCRALYEKHRRWTRVGRQIYPVISEGFWLCDILIRPDRVDGFLQSGMDGLTFYSCNKQTDAGLAEYKEWREAGAIHFREIEDHHFDVPCPHCGKPCEVDRAFPVFPTLSNEVAP